MSINERLKKVRKFFKLSQEAFAESLEIKRTAITDYEIGRLSVSNEVFQRISKKYVVNLNWLISGEGEMFLDRSEPPTNNIIEKADTRAETSKFINNRVIKDPKIAQLQGLINVMQENIKTKQELAELDLTVIPVETMIACGTAEYYNNEEPLEQLYIPKAYIRNSLDYHCFVAYGNSMEPDVCNGDYVLIRKYVDWQNIQGKIVAFHVENDGITLKKIFIDKETNTIILTPSNPAYQPSVFNPEINLNIAVVGTLAFIFRKL